MTFLPKSGSILQYVIFIKVNTITTRTICIEYINKYQKNHNKSTPSILFINIPYKTIAFSDKFRYNRYVKEERKGR